MKFSNDAMMRRCYDATMLGSAWNNFILQNQALVTPSQKYLLINPEFMTGKLGVYDE